MLRCSMVVIPSESNGTCDTLNEEEEDFRTNEKFRERFFVSFIHSRNCPRRRDIGCLFLEEEETGP
ncbi:hypothetical protein WN55_08030 [Dufourea novaeangliae]|uniref:Uncharacterized protein n=1 Tax=Dufourea novaeangliae TaxID=178035 RepID=A0A154P966_DUFNO|nr:hypothetical protein WN55_08030 [Dufourea novaeangliae]